MVRDTRKADKIPVFKGLTELGSRQKVRSPISVDLRSLTGGRVKRLGVLTGKSLLKKVAAAEILKVEEPKRE